MIYRSNCCRCRLKGSVSIGYGARLGLRIHRGPHNTYLLVYPFNSTEHTQNLSKSEAKPQQKKMSTEHPTVSLPKETPCGCVQATGGAGTEAQGGKATGCTSACCGEGCRCVDR